MIDVETNRLHQARGTRVQRSLRAMVKVLEAQLSDLDRNQRSDQGPFFVGQVMGATQAFAIMSATGLWGPQRTS